MTVAGYVAVNPEVDTTGTAPTFEEVPVSPHSSWLLVDPAGRHFRVSVVLDVQRTERGHWLATHPDIMTHGVGRTREAAVRDFQSMLLDLFRELVDSEDVLAPHLRRELRYLRTILVEDNLL